MNFLSKRIANGCRIYMDKMTGENMSLIIRLLFPLSLFMITSSIL